jgi:hypothetical protein
MTWARARRVPSTTRRRADEGAAVECVDLRVALGDPADPHQLAHSAPGPHRCLDLVGMEASPPEAIQPALGLAHEGAEHVEVVVVGDLEAAVDLVHAPDRLAPAALAVAVLIELADEDRGVVVALLGAVLEFFGRVEQPADAGDRIRAEERELQRLGHVPRKLADVVQPDDLLVIALGVQSFDVIEQPHGPHGRPRRGRVGPRTWLGRAPPRS